ncbi:S-formylglutathione hydrolase [Tepidamorphus sp. 3E244]|uniref:S-formylglutathione hydrolase n=1 Tax=Tepidamorphus sp. 3E244 TaxID=3385498 RepID=UPI0038FC20B7
MAAELETVSEWTSHGGTQKVIKHPSDACACDMTFSVFLPPQAKDGPCPVLFYLSGLTCTHANVTEKGEFRAAAAEHGIIIVCPDTSPRGETVADEDVYYFGSGAGFYVDATQDPYAANYNMARYVTEELPSIIAANFPAEMDRQSIFGHSMGGHGALVLSLRNPGRYRSVSAFAPICHPSVAEWGRNAFTKYLGDDESAWRKWDSVSLIEDGAKLDEILVDQGNADEFLASGLRPWLLEEACDKAGIQLTLRMQDGYDHSYYFISSFMADHIGWHADRLKK